MVGTKAVKLLLDKCVGKKICAYRICDTHHNTFELFLDDGDILCVSLDCFDDILNIDIEMEG